jgi:Rod binding domain-containing protein
VNSTLGTTAAVPGQVSPAAPEPRLVRAAHEFEAQMMKELMKPMTAGDALSGEDEDSGSGGALGQFASEALGRALSEQGGFGIASRIVADLSHSGSKSGNGPVTRNLHGNTVMRALE